MNNDSLSEENSRKRDRSDSEKNGANFDRSAKIFIQEVIERPILKKKEYDGVIRSYIFPNSDSSNGSIEQNKKIKNPLSLKLPEDDFKKLEEAYKKDICPCNYLNELIDKFGKYVKKPTFNCHIHGTI